MKQTAVELLKQRLIKDQQVFPIYTEYINGILYDIDNELLEIEKQQKGYSEEELLAFGKSCFYKGFEKSEKDDANCFTAFREEIGSLIEQFKKRDEIK